MQMLGIENQAIKVYFKVALQVMVVFVVVYGLANYWSQNAPYQFHFWMDWERTLPFVPSLILIYFSLNLLLVLPVFFLTPEELTRLGRAMIFSTLVAGIIFFAFPAPYGFPRPTPTQSHWEWIYSLLYRVDETGNTLPSLHITFSWIVVQILVQKKPATKVFFYAWMFAISIAVLLVKQHHFLDILAGLVLGSLAVAKIYHRP